jgi:cellulose synthase/poly-beta-1,6-N-acetylglucosamine synthase-like glycosyltransferase
MITAIIVALITAAYLALGRAGMSRLRKERSSLENPAILPLISIIIPAYMSHGTIAATLKSAREIDYPRKEIIVVNDSQDSTPSIARNFGARVIQNRQRLGKPAALNRAAREARGSLIFFLDADTIASPGCLMRMVPWFSVKGVAAVMPKYLLKGDSSVSRLASLENLFTFALLRIHMFFGTIVGFRGCSVLMRKDIIKKHPWPDTLLEDNHLSATLASRGHRIIWEPRAVTWTDEPSTYREIMRQKRRWGEGAYLAFRCHRNFYLRSPQFMLFFYPYFALGIASVIMSLALLASPIFVHCAALHCCILPCDELRLLQGSSLGNQKKKGRGLRAPFQALVDHFFTPTQPSTLPHLSAAQLL